MNSARRGDAGRCGPSTIAFGGALLIATSFAPGLAADVAWSWLSAGAAGLSSAVALSERHKQKPIPPEETHTPSGAGEPLFVLSVLRNDQWIETSAVHNTVDQALHAAAAVRRRLGCQTAVSVLDPRFDVSSVNPRALSGERSPAGRG